MNGVLVDTLIDTANELADERTKGNVSLERLVAQLQDADVHLRLASEDYDKAVHQEGQVALQHKALLDHCDGLPDMPQAYIAKLSLLSQQRTELAEVASQALAWRRLREKKVADWNAEIEKVRKRLEEINVEIRQIHAQVERLQSVPDAAH